MYLFKKNYALFSIMFHFFQTPLWLIQKTQTLNAQNQF